MANPKVNHNQSIMQMVTQRMAFFRQGSVSGGVSMVCLLAGSASSVCGSVLKGHYNFIT